MKAPRIAAHTAFSFASVFVTSLLGVLLSAMIARGLKPDLMGTYTLVVYLASIAGLFINLGFNTTALRFASEAMGKENSGEAAGVLRYSLGIVLRNGALVMLLYCLLAPLLAFLYRAPSLTSFLLASSLGLVPFALVAVLTASFQGLQRYDLVALNSAICAPLTLGGSFLALRLGAGIPGLLVANAFATLCGGLLFLFWLLHWEADKLPVLPAETKDRMWRYSHPMFGMLLLDAVVWQRSGVFFLGLFAPSREIAFYSLAFGLATMSMRLLPGSLIGLLIPNMARSHGAGDPEGIRKIFRKSCHWMAILAFPVAIGGSLLASPLLEVLFGKSYLPSTGSLIALLLSGAVVMAYGFPSSSVLYASDGERAMLKIGLGVALLNVLLAFCLIPSLGALGAAAANAVSQGMSVIPGLWIVRKRLKVSPPAGIAKVLRAATIMGLVVAGLAASLPPLQAIAASLLIAPPIYAFCLFQGNALDAEDRATLLEAVSRLKQRWVIERRGGAV